MTFPDNCFKLIDNNPYSQIFRDVYEGFEGMSLVFLLCDTFATTIWQQIWIPYRKYPSATQLTDVLFNNRKGDQNEACYSHFHCDIYNV